MNYIPTNDYAVLGTIDPDAATAAAYNGDWQSFEYFEAMSFILLAGILNAGATVDFKLQEATSSTGAGAQDISGKAITQFTTGDNDKQAIINLRAPEMSSGYTHARMVLTVGSTGADVAAVGLGFYPIGANLGAYERDLSTVDEIVA